VNKADSFPLNGIVQEFIDHANGHATTVAIQGVDERFVFARDYDVLWAAYQSLLAVKMYIPEIHFRQSEFPNEG